MHYSHKHQTPTVEQTISFPNGLIIHEKVHHTNIHKYKSQCPCVYMRRSKRQPPKVPFVKKSFFPLKRLYEYSTFLSQCLLVGSRVVNRCQSPIKKKYCCSHYASESRSWARGSKREPPQAPRDRVHADWLRRCS